MAGCPESQSSLTLTRWTVEGGFERSFQPPVEALRDVYFPAMNEKNALVLHFGFVFQVQSNRNTDLLLLIEPKPGGAHKNLTQVCKQCFSRCPFDLVEASCAMHAAGTPFTDPSSC